MNRTRNSPTTSMVAVAVAAGLATACAGNASPAADATQRPTPAAEAEPTTTALPEEELKTFIDALPAEIRVPGVVVGVSTGSETWIGAAGIDDTGEQTRMDPDRQFRAASITKMFTATIVMDMVEEGRLSLDDTLDGWFPDFPNADDITVRMLLSHTGGVTGDWWQNDDIAQLALDDLGRAWTPTEVLDVMSTRVPAGPPASPTVYSNTGFVLLGEIAAEIGGAPIGQLIHDRILEPLELDDTAYQYDPTPRLAHAHYELDGNPLDMTSIPMQALPSMAGAAGAIQTTASDLLTFVSTLLGTDSILDRDTTATMASQAGPGRRFQLGLMGFCPCDGGYTGWGHTGDLPGHFSVAAHFPTSDASVVIFLNSDVVDGETFAHDHLDPIVEELVTLATTGSH